MPRLTGCALEPEKPPALYGLVHLLGKARFQTVVRGKENREAVVPQEPLQGGLVASDVVPVGIRRRPTPLEHGVALLKTGSLVEDALDRIRVDVPGEKDAVNAVAIIDN